LIVLSSLDRVNISFAALQMNADLSLAPEAYGLAVGLFFVGYLLCQCPSTWVLTRIGAKRWIAGSVVLWGTVATAMAFVQTAEQLYVLRFLLGCAESGFAPGIVYYWHRHPGISSGSCARINQLLRGHAVSNERICEWDDAREKHPRHESLGHERKVSRRETLYQGEESGAAKHNRE
jgi:hypothetical protein